MAEVKWIKVYTNMISNKKIKRIRTLPEGNNIILIWVFLLAQAGESNKNGALYLTDTLPFRAEDLAVEFDFDLTVINLALATLERFSMIEVFEDIIYIKNWGEYQNIDGLEKIREQTRVRVANHREKQRQLMASNICQYCGSSATGYDHVIATARGGKDSENNKVPCCIDCNRIKNDKPLVDFLNSNRGRINDDLVLSNPILSSHVTLCNVTHRYKVTQGNATDIELDKDKELDKDIYIEEFFKTVWSLYPNKKGVGAVNKKNKLALYKLGLEKVTSCINAYTKYVEAQRKTGFDLKYQNGSTFFNSGYKDYLANEVDRPTQKPTVEVVEGDYLG